MPPEIIKNSSTGIDSITTCKSYTWLDSIVYTSSTNSPTYNMAGGASNGCDSLITLNLIIINVSDISTNTNGDTISANLLTSGY